MYKALAFCFLSFSLFVIVSKYLNEILYNESLRIFVISQTFLFKIPNKIRDFFNRTLK